MASWNAPTNYSQKDILTMQQDAMRRVREMQARAKQPFESQNTPQPATVNKPHFSNNNVEAIHPMPNQLPHNNQHDNSTEHKPVPPPQNNLKDNLLGFLNLGGSGDGKGLSSMLGGLGEGKGLTSIISNFIGSATDKTPLGGVLKALDLDTEKLIIIGLMIILYNEGADALLLIALGYLLI